MSNIRSFKKLLFFCILCSLLFQDTYASGNQETKILVIHSYHRGYAWTEGEHRGFEDALQTQIPATHLQVYCEYLDTKRRQYTLSYQKFLFKYFHTKYRNFSPDLIYVTDDNALKFIQRFGKTLFPKVPVVFSGVNDLEQAKNLSPVLQGVFERLQVYQNLRLIRLLHPEEKEIIFIGDGSETYKAMLDLIIKEASKHYPKLRLIFIEGPSLNKVLGTLGHKKSGVVLLTTIGGMRDSQGQVVSLPASIKQISEAGKFHLFIMEDTYLLPGAIGGWVNSGRAHGLAAGKVALNMLLGSYSPITNGNMYLAEAVFNYNSLKAHKLTRDLLPVNSIIINEPSNLFYKYKNEILIVFSIITILLGIIVFLSFNVRRRKRAEKLLQASRWQMVRLFEDAPDAIYLVDFNGNILDVNEHAVESLGFTRNQLRTLTVFDIDPQFDSNYLEKLSEAVKIQEKYHFESQHRHANGRIFPVDIRVSRCEWQDQPALLCYVRDITERKQVELQLLENEERLHNLAFHDPLTELPNRLLFQDRLDHAINLAQRQNAGLAVLFLDLDRFKVINDSLGHHVGDRVLCQVAERLLQVVRNTDTVARLGGDEFVILIEGATETDFLVYLAQKVIEAVQPPMDMKEGELFVTTSLGMALYPQDASTPNELMKLADVAMYQAKTTRNAYRFYQPEMDARATEFLFMESSLRRALEQDQLVLHYQPQFDLQNNTLVGMEALVRWNHPEMGMVPPGDFIPLAEETGLIIPMGEWVLQEACSQIKKWIDADLPQVPVSINISPSQFSLNNWSQVVAEVLDKSGVDPSLLELEITENLLMEHSQSAIATMDALQAMGVSIIIDDFGAGYSSLAYLKQYPLKKLKIDRSFITDFKSSFNDAAIVCAMINLGFSLGLQVVAEGIETNEQLQFLTEKGCHQGQGYMLGVAMPADDIVNLLKDHR